VIIYNNYEMRRKSTRCCWNGSWLWLRLRSRASNSFSDWKTRVCLKNHFRSLHAPLCGIFCPHSVAVARYASFIQTKSPTNWNMQTTKSLFQTHS